MAVKPGFEVVGGSGGNNVSWKTVPRVNDALTEEVFTHLQSTPELEQFQFVSTQLSGVREGEELVW